MQSLDKFVEDGRILEDDMCKLNDTQAKKKFL